MPEHKPADAPPRSAVALGILVLCGLQTVAAAAPALAVYREDGDQPGPPLGIGRALLLYVGAPAALFLLIALLVLAPSLRRGPRYRPGRAWQAEPVWFGGPAGTAGVTAALEAGASSGDTSSSRDAAGADETAGTRSTRGGGASARW